MLSLNDSRKMLSLTKFAFFDIRSQYSSERSVMFYCAFCVWKITKYLLFLILWLSKCDCALSSTSISNGPDLWQIDFFLNSNSKIKYFKKYRNPWSAVIMKIDQQWSSNWSAVIIKLINNNHQIDKQWSSNWPAVISICDQQWSSNWPVVISKCDQQWSANVISSDHQIDHQWSANWSAVVNKCDCALSSTSVSNDLGLWQIEFFE